MEIFRVGNYIVNTEQHLLRQMRPMDIVNNRLHPERYERITLSSEWFGRFGFISIGTGFTKNGFDFVPSPGIWVVRIGDTIITSIQFVDELQNLWFALKREELVIDYSLIYEIEKECDASENYRVTYNTKGDEKCAMIFRFLANELYNKGINTFNGKVHTHIVYFISKNQGIGMPDSIIVERAITLNKDEP